MYSYFMFNFLHLLIKYKYFFCIFCQFLKQLFIRTLLESLLKIQLYYIICAHIFWLLLKYHKLLVDQLRHTIYINCLSNLANFQERALEDAQVHCHVGSPFCTVETHKQTVKVSQSRITAHKIPFGLNLSSTYRTTCMGLDRC